MNFTAIHGPPNVTCGMSVKPQANSIRNRRGQSAKLPTRSLQKADPIGGSIPRDHRVELSDRSRLLQRSEPGNLELV